MTFTRIELDYLATQTLGRLATVQRNGTLQVSPVGFHYNPDTATIDISGYNMTGSRKFHNVADNGRVAFVVDDIASVDPWQVRWRSKSVDGQRLWMLQVLLRMVSTRRSSVSTAERIISFGLDDKELDVHQLVVNGRDVGRRESN